MSERLQVRIPAGAAVEFSSPELTLCADSFDVRSNPVLPQWHVKDPGQSAKSAGGRLHLNTHTSLTQRSRSGLTMPLSRHSVGTYTGNELTRSSSGNTLSQSFQLVEPLWTDPGLKSGIGVRELISTLKKKKKAQAGNELSNIFTKSSHSRGKKSHNLFKVLFCSV